MGWTPVRRGAMTAAKIQYLDPSTAGPLAGWDRRLAEARSLGFDHLALPPPFLPGHDGDLLLTADHEHALPALAAGRSADEAVARIVDACRDHQLALALDLVIDRAAADGAFIEGGRGLYRVSDRAIGHAGRPVAVARFEHAPALAGLTEWWVERLMRLAAAGVAAFRCLHPGLVPPALWRDLIRAVPSVRFLAWTPGVAWNALPTLEGVGFAATFASTAWWDGRAAWLAEEHEALRRVAPPIGTVEAPFGDRLATRLKPRDDVAAAHRRALRLAAATASGILVPAGFERPVTMEDLCADVRAANGLVDRIDALGVQGEMRALSGPGSAATAILRSDAADVRMAQDGVLILINPDLEAAVPSGDFDTMPPSAGAAFTPTTGLCGAPVPAGDLEPAEVRIVRVERAAPVRPAAGRARQTARRAAMSPRLVIERLTPAVDGGRFPTKRVVGEVVAVEADIYADGHDMLAANLLWRPEDETDWRTVPMRPAVNDVWRAEFTPARVGRHLFTVEAWWDRYGSFHHEIEAKHGAGIDLALETVEGRRMIEATAADAADAERFQPILDRLRDGTTAEQLAVLLDDATTRLMQQHDDQPFVVRHSPHAVVDAERPQAGFAAWYEMFPRSATDDPARHGTFADVIARLPAIRAMGFDVLYFPPIHPIGTTNRKGPNNSLTSDPDDPGSPYAIGSAEGGHDAIHRELGTIEDFRRLRDAASANGLELALDFAIQCSPDHPWLTQHPDWFRWRPDGSIRYAENPPKKYQDIVNVDFYADGAVPALWNALRDIVLFWIGEGVLTFRVDNPHTKPLPFWEWMIADVRSRHPNAIFLAEAFTRPKMMHRLAKIGFSQSYTYFTWRNGKAELTEYLTELAQGPARDFFRPHFFVNTPDINPIFLQTSGRPGFLVRAALAATLAGLWGVYSGFEHCEGAPLPGREEYLDSEKYQLRVRPPRSPGDIVDEITALNRIRRTHPALQTHRGLAFYNAFDNQVLVYGKGLPEPGMALARAIVLVAVNLDPFAVHECDFEVPLWEWGLPDHAAVEVEDLVRGHRFAWTGKRQRVRLDPADLPYAIWRIAPLAGDSR